MNIKYTIKRKVANLIGPILTRLVWSDRTIKWSIQKHGVNLIPVDFYSNIPSLREIDESYEYCNPEPPYLSALFDDAHLVQILEKLIPFAEEFAPPHAGDEQSCERYFWENSQFGFSDAMAYYCFIRCFKPKRVMEIGSGFSTLVALEAAQENMPNTKIISFEPFPRPFLEKLPNIELHKKKAQEITAEFINDTLEDGDFLFIDSTHTVKTGSDCLHLYLRVIPQIRRNLIIHSHDIFLPYGFPKSWFDQHIYWTEQYLLLALLTDNPKMKILYGSNYHRNFHIDLQDKMMGGKTVSGGGSFWYSYLGKGE